MWDGASGCARGSQAWNGTRPALVPKPISAPTITSAGRRSRRRGAGFGQRPRARARSWPSRRRHHLCGSSRGTRTRRRAPRSRGRVRIAAAAGDRSSAPSRRGRWWGRASATTRASTIWKRPVRSRGATRARAREVPARVEHRRHRDDGDGRDERAGEGVDPEARVEAVVEVHADRSVAEQAQGAGDAEQRRSRRLEREPGRGAVGARGAQSVPAASSAAPAPARQFDSLNSGCRSLPGLRGRTAGLRGRPAQLPKQGVGFL